METLKIDPAAAGKTWATVVGEYVWASRVGQDAILRLDFGIPRLHIHEPSPRAETFGDEARTALARRVVLPVGRWHLFVESGLWRVAASGTVCERADAEGDDPAKAKQIAKCLSLLDGQKLTAARGAANGNWQLDFDLGGLLSIAVDAAEPSTDADAVWTLFSEDETNLSYMADRTFVFERATPAAS